MPIDLAQTLHEYRDKLEKFKIKQIRKEELILKSKNIKSKLTILDSELLELETELNTFKTLLKI